VICAVYRPVCAFLLDLSIPLRVIGAEEKEKRGRNVGGGVGRKDSRRAETAIAYVIRLRLFSRSSTIQMWGGRKRGGKGGAQERREEVPTCLPMTAGLFDRPRVKGKKKNCPPDKEDR